MSQPMTQREPNRLIREKSPYLLQHAHNPVDWYPWGEEAFERARREDRPIFLSIGYSTCHWCHVMERESFENEAVAELLDRWFVPIKVDREERPDVDRLYMTAMQAMGLGGGWPLNVFLTPDLEPFFGGTYFPPEARQGHAGLMELLPRIHEVWSERRQEVAAQGAQVLHAIATAMAAPDPTDANDVEERRSRRERLFTAAAAGLAQVEDLENGGFGAAPKFPSPSNLAFLARYASRDFASRAAALRMARRQLDAMEAGGIHDHLGGGFHRYSTDAQWRVPHFEKMLYDQAQLAWAYLDGLQIARVPGPHGDDRRAERYARTARGIFDYVARDLTSPEGAFHSAEDADSEGEEGRFYVWTQGELEAVLGSEETELFAAAFGVTPEGNFENGASILHRVRDTASLAEQFGVATAEIAVRLDQSRERLRRARERRPRPHRDDKVLTAWNGLMISAFARGARILADERLAERAKRAAEFVWARLRDSKTGALRRRYRDGEVAGEGQLADYANLARGAIDLYGATFDPVWLGRAEMLMTEALERFWDDRAGGFFESPAGDPSIKVRFKDDFDGAELAGSSIAGWVLWTLATVLDRDPWRARAERSFDFHAARLAGHPLAMPQMLVAMDLAASPPSHVVIAGDPCAAATHALVREFDCRFRPRDLLLVAPPDGAEREVLARLAPFTAPLAPRGGGATAFVCVDYTCQLPVSDPRAFGEQLDAQ